MLGRLGRVRHPMPWFGLGVFLSWLARFLLDAGVRAEFSRGNPAGLLITLLFFAGMMAVLMSGLFTLWLRWRLRDRGPGVWPNPGVPLLLGILHPWLCLAAAYLYALGGPVGPLVSQLISAAVLYTIPVGLAQVLLLFPTSRRA